MSIIKAYVFPHPPLAIPEVGRGEENKIKKTLDALDKAVSEIARLAPETIVFITPHNVVYSDYFHISPGETARGSLRQFSAPQTQFQTEYDTDLAAEIAKTAQQHQIAAGTEGEKSAELDHGVTVPMYFINLRYKEYRTVRISQSGMSTSDHYIFGKCIAEAVSKSQKKTVIIASGDLSHKLPGSHYGSTPEGAMFDKKITGILSSADFLPLFGITEKQRSDAAECGYNSIMTLAGCFDRIMVKPKLCSYEGPFGVGYAVAEFSPAESDQSRNFLDIYNQAALKKTEALRQSENNYTALARNSLEHKITHGDTLKLPENLPGEMTKNKAGVFVSLHKYGQLRGCIGTTVPTTANVALEIIQNAVSAGLSDNRFEPVKISELPYLTYKVDVLSSAEEIKDPKELDVKRYGVIVSSRYRRGLLLPNLEGVDTVADQLAIAKRKAGIPECSPVKLERFEVIRYE
ncbi:MAG: AmmeMemoRadiSam system protein A [Oscillospiraceae bacterium]|nr:AmmeMemoRadiSam system protein A [Oscillospiraceae bacterium]